MSCRIQYRCIDCRFKRGIQGSISMARRRSRGTYSLNETRTLLRRMDLVQIFHHARNVYNIWLLLCGIWCKYDFYLFVGKTRIKCFGCISADCINVITFFKVLFHFLCNCKPFINNQVLKLIYRSCYFVFTFLVPHV